MTARPNVGRAGLHAQGVVWYRWDDRVTAWLDDGDVRIYLGDEASA